MGLIGIHVYAVDIVLILLFQGSLIANMIMGIWMLKKQYTLSKYLSVGMITLGIIICTLLSSGKQPPKVYSSCINVLN